jgi:transposase-like protein
MSQKIQSKELMELAVSLYKKDISGNEIAKKLAISPNTVYRMLHNSGIYIAGRAETKPCRILVKGEVAEKIICDYNNGMNWVELGSKYGYGQYSMREAIRRAGVKIKDHGGQRRRVYKEEEKEIVRLYKEEGFTQAQICVKLNIGQTVLSRVLLANGINPSRGFGENHGSWKGGISKNGDGYILIRDQSFPEMLNRSGYVLQHRLEMAKYLNRPLTKNESVHHIDGDKENNDISNLQLRIGKHGSGVTYCCQECGSKKLKPIEL